MNKFYTFWKSGRRIISIQPDTFRNSFYIEASLWHNKSLSSLPSSISGPSHGRRNILQNESWASEIFQQLTPKVWQTKNVRVREQVNYRNDNAKLKSFAHCLLVAGAHNNIPHIQFPANNKRYGLQLPPPGRGVKGKAWRGGGRCCFLTKHNPLKTPVTCYDLL